MQSKQPFENSYVQMFDSLAEFYDYICSTPFNEAFRWAEHSSVKQGFEATRFTQTVSFDDAVLLMKRGWSDMAQKLVNKLNAIDKKTQPIKKARPVNSVAGYQPIVPLYLAGVPTSMVSSKMVPVKQKVINITKLFNYNGGISSDKIINESIKVMQLVKKLEAQGYRVNVDVAFGSSAGGREIAASIRVKSANERLQVSKLAFPLVHPSMLRRLMLRYIEVNNNVTRSYVHGYGAPVQREKMQKLLPDSIVIPAIWEVQDINTIHNIDDIKGTV